jgi:hypothetical protein
MSIWIQGANSYNLKMKLFKKALINSKISSLLPDLRSYILLLMNSSKKTIRKRTQREIETKTVRLKLNPETSTLISRQQ